MGSNIRSGIFIAMGGVLSLALGIVILNVVATLGLVDATTSANLVSTAVVMSGFLVIVGLFAIFKLLE